jgi:uncharacterized protein YceK
MMRMLSVVLAAGIALAGCSSSTTATSSSTATKPAASASPSSTADQALQWCTAYAEITSALSTAPSTKEGAQTSLNALGSFDQLWAAGANLGYLTQEESDANRRAIVAYSQLVTQYAQGKKDTDQAVKDAQANLTKVTTADKPALTSSAAKVSALCGPLTAAPSSAGASPASS